MTSEGPAVVCPSQPEGLGPMTNEAFTHVKIDALLAAQRRDAIDALLAWAFGG